MTKGWGLVVLLVLVFSQQVYAQAPLPPACPQAPDFPNTTYRDWIDTYYGAANRQVVRPSGTDRNIYHFRNPWNMNNTRMVAVREGITGVLNDHGTTNSWVSLYDGNGCFIRQLYSLNTFGWEITWSKTDPDIFYIVKSPRVWSYNVTNDVSTELVNVTPMQIGNSPTLNQPGTRIGVQVVTPCSPTPCKNTDLRFRSWDLPNMTNMREFTPTHQSWTDWAPMFQTPPQNCDTRNWRYVGWGDAVVTDCRNDLNNLYGAGFYQDTGTFIRYSAREIGHVDVGPTGLFAYFIEGGADGNGTDIDIHILDLTTGVDTVTYQFAAGGQYDNMHLTWPRNVPNWFVLGFFSNCSNPPTGTTTTVAPFDQLYKITTDNPAVVTVLGKSFTCEYAGNWDHDNDSPGKPNAPCGCVNNAPPNNCTACVPVTNNLGITSYFWTQPEPEPSADGSRILTNMNCDQKPINLAAPIDANNCTPAFEGDLHIIFTGEGEVVPPPGESVKVSGKAGVKGKVTVK